MPTNTKQTGREFIFNSLLSIPVKYKVFGNDLMWYLVTIEQLLNMLGDYLQYKMTKEEFDNVLDFISSPQMQKYKKNWIENHGERQS